MSTLVVTEYDKADRVLDEWCDYSAGYDDYLLALDEAEHETLRTIDSRTDYEVSDFVRTTLWFDDLTSMVVEYYPYD